MGTRGLSGFYANGKPLLAYSQYDSHPFELGLQILGYVRENLTQTPNGLQFEPGKLERIFALVVVNQSDEPTDDQLLTLENNLGSSRALWQEVSTGKDWYSYLRSAQGDLDRLIESGFFIDSSDFGRDSLFCENSYVINVDDRTLDYYEGFNGSLEPETEGIWAGIEIPLEEKHTRDDGSVYTLVNKFGVSIRTIRFSFDQIPGLTDDEFLKQIQIAPRARHRAEYIDADGNYVAEGGNA